MTVRHGLKIGCTGAGGTGKTTSVSAISKELGINQQKSASRIVYERLDLTEEKCYALSNEKKYDLQFDIFETKIRNDQSTFSFIADRTLLDHWAYCLMYCGAYIPNEEYAEYEEKVRVHMKSQYTHIFYFPFGYWFAEGDGVRQDHHSWQSAIDAIIVGYINRWRLPVFEVPQIGGAEARNKFIIDKLKNIR